MNIIIDLDGTLCDNKHREHLIKQAKPDWDAYFLACGADTPMRPTISAAQFWAHAGQRIIILSGRGEIARAHTENWLALYRVPYNELLMRPIGDFTPDEQLKWQWAVELGLTPANTFVVLDDRDKVVRMWREGGFTCWQVAPGDF